MIRAWFLSKEKKFSESKLCLAYNSLMLPRSKFDQRELTNYIRKKGQTVFLYQKFVFIFESISYDKYKFMFDRLHKTYLSISYKGSIIVFIMLIFIFSKTFLINNQFSSYPKMTILF